MERNVYRRTARNQSGVAALGVSVASASPNALREPQTLTGGAWSHPSNKARLGSLTSS